MLGILFAIIGYSIFCMKKDSDHPAWYQHPWTLFWTLPFSIHQKLKAPTVWDLAEVPDKTSVEICKTQKPLHFLAGLGHQPFHHCFNLCWVRSQSPLFHKKQRKETVGAWNSHFSALTKSRFSSRWRNISLTCFRCSARVLRKIRILTQYYFHRALCTAKLSGTIQRWLLPDHTTKYHCPRWKMIRGSWMEN